MVNIELVREGYARVLTVPRNVLVRAAALPWERRRRRGLYVDGLPPRSRVPYAPVAPVGQGIRGHSREIKSDSE
jgi:endonuclease YncB( thermonuclease family)